LEVFLPETAIDASAAMLFAAAFSARDDMQFRASSSTICSTLKIPVLFKKR
jgi:hypothetical protein